VKLLVPDRYAAVLGPKVARFWITGNAHARPTLLDLSSGAVVHVDARTQLLGTCFGRPPCFAFLARRAHTQIADWIFGTIGRPGQPYGLEGVPIWHVGRRFVILSSGLSLRLAPTTDVQFSDEQLRKLGTLVSIAFDASGAVATISHGGCA
jgi:hypothetical protein